ncbi:hypothetical protein ACTTAL_18545 (plasmid) [Rhodobacter capsulatus]
MSKIVTVSPLAAAAERALARSAFSVHHQHDAYPVTHETFLILRRAEIIYLIAENRLNYSPLEYRNAPHAMRIARDIKRKAKAV